MNPFGAIFKVVKALMRIKNRSFYEKGGFIFVVSGMFGQTVTFIKEDSLTVKTVRYPLWLRPFNRLRLTLVTRGRRRMRRHLYLPGKRRYLNTPI